MTNLGAITAVVTVATWTAVLTTPAAATRMDKHNAGHGCEQLVTVNHPDLKGKERGAEIKKCKADPDGYNKT
jgi:hypothetical protein